MPIHKLHVICARTNTFIGRCIWAFTADDVNHCAIYLDHSANCYSFRRENRYNLLSGKFGKETLSDMARGSPMYYTDTEIVLSMHEYMRLKHILKSFHRNKYRYNYLALILLKFDRGINNHQNMICSTFTAYMLSHVISLDYPFYRYTPIQLNNELKTKFPTKTTYSYYNK